MSGTHVIRRQLLEIELAGSEDEAVALQERLPELSRAWLAPMLERVFERVVPGREHWLLDRVYVDAGTFGPDDLERGFVDAVTQELERQLRENMPPTSTAEARSMASPATATPERKSEAETLEEAFVYFLRTGQLPWWFLPPREGTLEDRIRELWDERKPSGARPEHFARAVLGIIRQRSALKRLLRQFSGGFLGSLLAGVAPDSVPIVREVLARLGAHGISGPALESFAEHLWEAAFASAADGTSPGAETLIVAAVRTMHSTEPPAASLLEAIRRDWPATAEQRVDETAGPVRPRPAESDEQHDPDPGQAEGVFVGCAGIVLLHPFLPRLFEALGIAKEEQLLQPERALALLHFLATGQRFAPEYDLLLPKLLCNVPVDAPVRSRIGLTAAEEEEAVALLAAVIRHWDALGDSSIDGLRGSFLVRPGKLVRRGDDYVLQVEARSFDLLLDRLPWGIGAIRLPWMSRMLWVEWRF